MTAVYELTNNKETEFKGSGMKLALAKSNNGNKSLLAIHNPDKLNGLFKLVISYNHYLVLKTAGRRCTIT